MEIVVFFISAVIVLSGGIGVVMAKNPVHAALFLVQTLFGMAVLFILQHAHFLAAVQVVVYAGAIVILFLFVIMLLGVDKAERLDVDPIVGQRLVAPLIGLLLFAGLMAVLVGATEFTDWSWSARFGDFGVDTELNGRPGAEAPIATDRPDVNQLGERLFTDWVFAFEITALLLTIAVVGAVVLARRITGELEPIPEAEDLWVRSRPVAADADGDDAVADGEDVADGDDAGDAADEKADA